VPRINWNALKKTLITWRDWGLPGAIATGLIIAARATGSLQGLELAALDTFLRNRPTEPPDNRIVLVGFDNLKPTEYPIPEQEIIDVINRIESYQPTVIGLHILKNQIEERNTLSLSTELQSYRNLIVSEVITPSALQVLAPSGFTDEQIGFIDIDSDYDLYLRKISLGLNDPIKLEIYGKSDGSYRHSLVVRIAEKYLTAQDSQLRLQNGIKDPFAMRFGNTEIPRLLEYSGGYVNVDVGNPDVLLNLRASAVPFQMFSAGDVKAGKVQSDAFRNRIVIIGITDPRIRPPISTASTSEINTLQIQAHGVSQIISAVLDGRPLLNTWSDSWEYLWIAGWGILAIIWGHTSFSNRIKLLGIGVVQLGLVGTSYLLLLLGWWIPVVPTSLIWLINSLGYTAFYKYDWVLRSRIKEEQRLVEDRQKLIEQIFNVIHNGPLQTLSRVLRQLRDQSVPTEKILPVLENLNTEIRQIGEHAKQEVLTDERSLYLRDGIKLDLQLPIHELLYEVYGYTLERPEFEHFESLKVSYDFQPVAASILAIEQCEILCRFLEEALCNVGKHSENATHLTVTGTFHKGWYTVQVVDDGVGLRSTIEGEGTRYARRVATQLGGKFKRESLTPKGTLCQLSLPLVKSFR
jgi:CHASE2 domain-containing sensor protein